MATRSAVTALPVCTRCRRQAAASSSVALSLDLHTYAQLSCVLIAGS